MRAYAAIVGLTMNAVRLEIVGPLVVFLSVVAVGASILLAREQRKKNLKLRLHDAILTGVGKPVGEKTSGALQFLEKIGNLASHGHATTALWEQLVRAGYFSAGAPAMYTGLKMFLFVVGCVATAVLVLPWEVYAGTKIALAFLGGAILFFIPNIVILGRLRARRAEISRHLPVAIDLLEICVSAGIGLDMAWNTVADEIQNVSPVLSSAMVLTNFEMHLGASRAEAMQRMAARTGVQELSSLAAILVQTDRFGSSIAATLRSFAISMRVEWRTAAEEDAEKIAVRLIIPMVLFIFPAVLIVGVGPAVISLTKALALGQ